jgi:uncharacterized protein
MDPFKTHGAISWPELLTSDEKGAADFYKNIFGWELKSMPMGPSGEYILGSLGENPPHAGIMHRVSEEMPPCWVYYVTVNSVDETAAKAVELGGQVFAPAMDLPGVGRMCGIADPQGAMIFAMQWAAQGPAIDFADAFEATGKFSWFELRTTDVDAAVSFYSELFGWTTEVNEMGMGPYTIVKIGDTSFGGIIPPMGEAPSHWSGYITASNADETAAAITANGGQPLGEPFDIPGVGRMVPFQDPQGAHAMALAYAIPSE